MFMLDKESGAIRRERASERASRLNASAAITPGTAVTLRVPTRQVHSDDGDGWPGKRQNSLIKVISVRVRLQRVSRKSSGCSRWMHMPSRIVRAERVVKGTRVPRLRTRFHEPPRELVRRGAALHRAGRIGERERGEERDTR